MYDTLTLAQLYQLHNDLYRQHIAIHDRLIDRQTRKPLIDPMDPEWDVLAAHEAEIWETMHAVYVEAARRERTDA